MLSFDNIKNNRFVLFCTVGAVSTLIDLTLLYVGASILGLNVLVAATLSFTTASINGYLLNQRLTFRSENGPSGKQYAKFLTVSLVGLALTLILLYVLTTHLFLHYMIAKIFTVALVVTWNYLANVVWTFK